MKKKKEEEERKRKELEEKRRKEELVRRQKEEEEKKKQAEAQAKIEEQKKNELIKQAEEVKRSSTAVEPQDAGPEEQKNYAIDGDVDDAKKELEASLISMQIISSRGKAFLMPCPELIVQTKKQVAGWYAFDGDMKKYDKDEYKLEKNFLVRYADGKQEPVKTVGEAINRVFNTISKPEKNLAPHQAEIQLQGYADACVQRIAELNLEFRESPDVIRYSIYKLTCKSFLRRLADASK